MATKKQRNYKVDFFVITDKANRKHSVVHDLLKNAGTNFTKAHPLDDGHDEKFQIRSIVPLGSGKSYKGIFGRCRYGEKPEQGTEDGKETDVDLKPGHGLVEKNYFLFFPDRNLLIYQRNSSGSHYSRLQRYLNLTVGPGHLIALDPILTTDAYKRLINGAEARAIDISFQQPKDASIYKDVFTQDAIKLVNNSGGVSARIRISVGRTDQRLISKIKDAAVTLARSGLAKVARVQLEGESDPVDLIADRIVETITVNLGENGRPDPDSLYFALDEALTNRRADLKTFFGG